MKTKKQVFIANASQWRWSCCFHLRHNFCFGGTFLHGAQKPPLMRILPSHAGGRPKKKRTKWHRFCCFLLGHDFCLGAQKPPLVRILPSHSMVKTKNKTNRSLSQMHPNGVGPIAFFWGTHSRLGHKNILWNGFCPHIWGWRLKTKRSLSQMHPYGIGPVAFFWGAILARLRGHISCLEVTAPKWPPWRRACMDISVENWLH